MAAPRGEAAVAPFGVWLSQRLEELEIDEDVYGSYINGILREEENEEEKSEALQAILSAFMDEDSLAVICKDIIQKWSETTNSITQEKNVEDEVHAIASMIEKQAQIVVKQKDTSEEEKSRKAAVLAQYANITDEEDEDEESHGTSGAFNFEDKSLFKNTNVESVLVAKKAEREKAREDAQKKKEQDKLQREKDKLAKQERKEKEKKRTQKGERKR
ncbi:coiled-coil domain-containing protein 43 [Chiloscyllium plagiosum]|uniref:coiled-coil domain-containing protein 43 n=1 Tax=Chiloscyllium plagiosum TaxID=36176 RepID=UPI001CB7D768|nr:coiled-coil domain-containing protein 43 [Chiloscyllium plagiosum]